MEIHISRVTNVLFHLRTNPKVYKVPRCCADRTTPLNWWHANRVCPAFPLQKIKKNKRSDGKNPQRKIGGRHPLLNRKLTCTCAYQVLASAESFTKQSRLDRTTKKPQNSEAVQASDVTSFSVNPVLTQTSVPCRLRLGHCC